jgi:asparagine synthase (glutamine-hydrolysing)
MCGINGYLSLNECFNGAEFDLSVLRMNSAIKHRGPNDDGVFNFKYGCIGHVRLSILDLSDLGHQPMKRNGFTIVFNGEIFNFLEIKQELIGLGFQFQTNTDTEVILIAFEHWGISSIAKFQGMFAFFIYDEKLEKGYIVRDRLGIKPLYILKNEKEILFSSEIRGIEALGVKLKINENVISQFLSLGYLPNLETPYQEIKKVENGVVLEINFKERTFVESKYWSIYDENNWQFKTDDVRELRRLIIKSVENRLISDVPLGLWLSGGLDSTLIATLISKELGKSITTLSLNFENKYSNFSEFNIAKKNAELLGHKSIELVINPDKVFEEIDDVLDFQEEWVGSPACVLYYVLSRETKKHVTVALTGLGGDEIFGGYNRYKALKMVSYIKNLPQPALKTMIYIANKISKDKESKIGNINRAFVKILEATKRKELWQSYLELINYFPENRLINSRYDGKRDIYTDVMKFDIQNYMQNELLLLSDKLSMAFGLELRVPLIDFPVIESAFSLNTQDRVPQLGKKTFLRNWIKSYDKNLMETPRKSGFSLPTKPFLYGFGKNHLKKQIFKCQIQELIPTIDINSEIEDFYSKKKENTILIFSLFVLSKWRIRKNI